MGRTYVRTPGARGRTRKRTSLVPDVRALEVPYAFRETTNELQTRAFLRSIGK